MALCLTCPPPEWVQRQSRRKVPGTGAATIVGCGSKPSCSGVAGTAVQVWWPREFAWRQSGLGGSQALRARGNAAGGTWRFTWMMRFGAGRACNGLICWPTTSTNCIASPRRSASIWCRIKVRRGPRFPITISRHMNGAAPSREGQLHVVATRSSRFCAGRDPPTILTCVPSRDGHLAGLTVAGFAREPARSFPASFPLASGLQSSRWRSDPASYPRAFIQEHIANGEQTVYIAPKGAVRCWFFESRS